MPLPSLTHEVEGEQKASLVPLGKAVALALAKPAADVEAEKEAAAAAEAEGAPAPEKERLPWYLALEVGAEVMAERAAAELAAAMEADPAPVAPADVSEPEYAAMSAEQLEVTLTLALALAPALTPNP